AFGAFPGNGFHADAGGVGEANLAVLLREGFLEEGEEFLAALGALFEFDAGVDVLGVLAEDHHVDFLWRLDRRWHPFEPAYWTQTDVEVKHLPQGDVEGTHAAADGRGERALDADQEFAKGIDGFIGKPRL